MLLDLSTCHANVSVFTNFQECSHWHQYPLGAESLFGLWSGGLLRLLQLSHFGARGDCQRRILPPSLHNASGSRRLRHTGSCPPLSRWLHHCDAILREGHPILGTGSPSHRTAPSLQGRIWRNGYWLEVREIVLILRLKRPTQTPSAMPR